MKVENFRSVLIKEEYFKDNSDFIKMLDEGEVDKQGRRNYIFIELKFKDNRLLVPLRTKLGSPNRLFGTIGFAVPSKNKPLAGLDYRYILIVNDEKYLEFQEQLEIPRSQQRILENNYKTIEYEAISYVKKYIACAIKNREEKEALFKESSLQNFNDELGVNEGRRLRIKELEMKNKKIKDKDKDQKIVEKEIAVESNSDIKKIK